MVAVDGEKITGFGNIEKNGHLDRLYVHKDFLRQGIADMICSKLEAFAGTITITTHASITARPFFEKRGYTTVKEQVVTRNGIELINYVMKKHIP